MGVCGANVTCDPLPIPIPLVCAGTVGAISRRVGEDGVSKH